MDFSLDSELEEIRRAGSRLARQFDDDYWRTHDEKRRMRPESCAVTCCPDSKVI